MDHRERRIGGRGEFHVKLLCSQSLYFLVDPAEWMAALALRSAIVWKQSNQAKSLMLVKNY
jgi:hypothetical protein